MKNISWRKTFANIKDKMAWSIAILRWMQKNMRWMRFLNPAKYIKILDWYIIKKFIGTYIYSIILIISISIVFDVNENLAKFAQYHAPVKAIVFDYYMNFVPYFANLFSPLFVFIAVIFFTSKLAGNSEIISMLAAGISFKRLMRPYMISAFLISVLTFFLGAYIIPKGTIVRQNFESMYKNKKKNTSAENVQLQVGKGVIAYIQHNKRHAKRLRNNDGTYRPRLLERTAGDIYKSATERIHKQTNRQRFKQCSTIRSGIPQTYSHLLCIIYPYDNRRITIFKEEKRRYGTISRNRTGSKLRIHHAADCLCNLCHTSRHTTYVGGLDSKHNICNSSIFLLPQSTKLIRNYGFLRFRFKR